MLYGEIKNSDLNNVFKFVLFKDALTHIKASNIKRPKRGNDD